jgi:hypothetical protein
MTTDSIEKEQPISDNEKVESKSYAAVYTLDTAAILFAAGDMTLTPEEAKRLRKKIDWHLLPLMSSASRFTLP